MDHWAGNATPTVLMPTLPDNDPGVTTSGQHLFYDLLPNHGSWVAHVRMPTPDDLGLLASDAPSDRPNTDLPIPTNQTSIPAT
jgi:hypothetical protein